MVTSLIEDSTFLFCGEHLTSSEDRNGCGSPDPRCARVPTDKPRRSCPRRSFRRAGGSVQILRGKRQRHQQDGAWAVARATPWMTRSRPLERPRVRLFAFSAKLSMNVCSPRGPGGADRKVSMSEAACSVRSFQWTTVKPAASMTVRNWSAEARWLSSGWSGPWERVVDLARCAGGDVPDGEPASGDERPACLLIQACLVGHVHLDVLADDHVEAGLGEGQSVTSP